MQLSSAIFYLEIGLSVIPLYLFLMQWIYCFRKRLLCVRSTSTKRKVDILTTMTATMGLLTVIVDSVSIHLRVNKILVPSTKRILSGALIIFFATTLLLVYSVLWLRQRSFYRNAALIHLTNKCTRFTSKYIILAIIITGCVISVVLGYVTLIHSCSKKCELILHLVSLILLMLTSQISLLCLFIHPLMKHHKLNTVTDQRYVPLIKRICILTGICLITDIVTVAVGVTLNENIPRLLIVTVNTLCIMLSMRDWKYRIFPCVASPSKDKIPNESVAPTFNDSEV